MRPRSYVVIAALALLLCAGYGSTQFPSGGPGGFGGGGRPDPSQLFDMIANGKSVVVISEISNPFMKSMAEKMAERAGITNGQITRDQYTAYQAQRSADRGSRGPSMITMPRGGSSPGGVPSPGGPPAGGMNSTAMWDQWAESLFRRYDQNGDGVLNYDEMPEQLRAERDKWDTNHDGLIDLSEFKAFFQAVMKQRMAEGGMNFMQTGGSQPMFIPVDPSPLGEEDRKPVVWRAGKLPKELPAWFKQIDTDGDGQISLYEWRMSGRPLDEFMKMDRNGDGFLTIEEVLYYTATVKAKSSPSDSLASADPSMGDGGFSPGSSQDGGTFSPGGRSKGGGQPGGRSKGGDPSGQPSGRSWGGAPGGGAPSGRTKGNR